MKTWHYVVIGIVVIVILYLLFRKPKINTKEETKPVGNWWDAQVTPGNTTLTNQQLLDQGYTQEQINQGAQTIGDLMNINPFSPFGKARPRPTQWMMNSCINNGGTWVEVPGLEGACINQSN